MAAETPKFFVHQLSSPVKVNNSSITELKVRTDIRARDFNAGDAVTGENAKGIRLLAHLSDVPPSTIADLAAKDWTAIMEKLAPFLGVSLPTSKTSSET
jgi:hypothetical protein